MLITNLLFFEIKYRSVLVKRRLSKILKYFCYLTKVAKSSSFSILLSPLCKADRDVSFFNSLMRQLDGSILSRLRLPRRVSKGPKEFYCTCILWELSLSKIFFIRVKLSFRPDRNWVIHMRQEPIFIRASANPPTSPRKSRGPYIFLWCSMISSPMKKSNVAKIFSFSFTSY